MMNYWWVTRPKRKLDSVPEVLATIMAGVFEHEWVGERENHLSVEEALESAGLKRIGDRRDQTGGGGRTYAAWLRSLGLIFIQESSKKIQLTLAGEAILNGESPVLILKNQVLKYQFPSPFSLGRGVGVSERFKIRPFRFLLKLLLDKRISYLKEDEIGKIIIVHAENESTECYELIVEKLLEYRKYGDGCIEDDFFERFSSSRKECSSFGKYLDIANTMVNWLEYTQLIYRSYEEIRIYDEKIEEVYDIVNNDTPLLNNPDKQENFQRKFGLDLTHKKDTRNLLNTKIVTDRMIKEQIIKSEYLKITIKDPALIISGKIVSAIVEKTSIDSQFVEQILNETFPEQNIDSFLGQLKVQAFSGIDKATDFEKTTQYIFENMFGYSVEHVGAKGLTPDLLLESEDYQAIIDNKAYKEYSINNDHKNRMIHNYLVNYSNYSRVKLPMAFFVYIAGGFGKNITSQVIEIYQHSGVPGSAITVDNLIYLIKKHKEEKYSHNELKNLFSINKLVSLEDIESLSK